MDDEAGLDAFAHAKKRAAQQRAQQSLLDKKAVSKLVSAQATQKPPLKISQSFAAPPSLHAPVLKSAPRLQAVRPLDPRAESRGLQLAGQERQLTPREAVSSVRSDISNTSRLTVEAPFRRPAPQLPRPRTAGVLAAHVEQLFGGDLPGFHPQRKVTLSRAHASSPVPSKKPPPSARGSSFGAAFHGDAFVESLKQHALAAQGDLTSFDLNREHMELVKKVMTAGNLFGKFVRCRILGKAPSAMGLLCLRLQVEHLDRAFQGDARVGEALFGLIRSENRTDNLLRDPDSHLLEAANPAVVCCTHSNRKYLMIKVFRMVKAKLN